MSASNSNPIDKIGDAAGQIWRCVSENGTLTVAQLVKRLELPRDQVMQGVGWLAREDKVRIHQKSRVRSISLNESEK